VRRLVGSALLLLLATSASAERLPIRTYTTGDGLARDYVNCIVHDNRGFLWLCTADGLSRFDGYGFANYTVEDGLPHRAISVFLQTSDGTYWVGTHAGVTLFNPRGSVRRPIAAHAAKTEAPAADLVFTVVSPPDHRPVSVTALFEDRSHQVWVGAAEGLYRIVRRGASWALQPAESSAGESSEVHADAITALIDDASGCMWVGTPDSLERRCPGRAMERYANKEDATMFGARAFARDADGRVWCGTQDGFARLVEHPAPGRALFDRARPVEGGINRGAVVVGADGALWAGTLTGVARFNPRETGAAVTMMTTKQGLPGPAITAIGFDAAGNLWFGSDEGASRLAHGGLTSFGAADGLRTRAVNGFAEDVDGHLIVFGSTVLGSTAFGDTIDLFDGQRFQPILPAGLSKNLYMGFNVNGIVLADREGGWWIVSWAPTHGLYRYDRAGHGSALNGRRPTEILANGNHLSGDFVSQVYEDRRGDVWIGVVTMGPADPLTRWDRATGEYQRFTRAEGIPGAPYAFAEDRAGNLWMGFRGTALRRRNGRFTAFGAKDGIPAGPNLDLLVDHLGRLWITGADGGVARIEDPNADRLQVTTYTTATGLASDEARTLVEDQWGRIYIGAGRGIDRLDPATGRIRHFSVNDGLASDNISTSYRDRSGALWFGTRKGPSRLIPALEPASPPPGVLISRVRVNGDPQPISAVGEVAAPPLYLDPSEKGIEIDFLGVALGLGERLQYQYKLEGADRDWGPPTPQRSVNYAHLAARQYRFLVRAVASDGAISVAPASLAFTVAAPVWARGWFIALVAAALALAAYRVHRFRVARLLELERVRTRIATDLHDDIGSGLSQIAILSEVARQKLGPDQAPLAEPLASIASSSRDLVDSMSDIVWAINPHRDTATDLVQRMRRFANDLLSARNLDLAFQVSGSEHAIHLSTDVRRQVYLIFKESLNNIVRHSGATAVDVDIRIDSAALDLRVSDNGRGLTPGAGEGHGLASMRARAQALGGRVSIETGVSGGTSVHLQLDLGHLQGRRDRVAT
jgi:signal transduction histidine kinase/ligand-binding sensor domain-containing protein